MAEDIKVTMKERVVKIERSIKLLNNLLKGLLVTNKAKNILTDAYTADELYEAIENAIRTGTPTHLDGVVISFGTQERAVGILQTDLHRVKVAKAICSVMNKEADTIAGSLTYRHITTEILIGILSPTESSDYLLMKLDDIVPDIDDVHIGETVIYPSDTIGSVLARIEYAYNRSKDANGTNYTKIFKYAKSNSPSED